MSTPYDALLSGELPIREEADIVTARRTVREIATQAGFATSDVARLVTAASELARNVYRYAGSGLMRWQKLERDSRVVIELKFIDEGPGIADIAGAMKEGFSSGGGLGIGLSGAKRLTDEMEIESVVGKGTTVTLRKWYQN
jgi:serine/threonine-protein kinase RsbT